jgi:hypothetical protein
MIKSKSLIIITCNNTIIYLSHSQFHFLKLHFS